MSGLPAACASISRSRMPPRLRPIPASSPAGSSNRARALRARCPRPHAQARHEALLKPSSKPLSVTRSPRQGNSTSSPHLMSAFPGCTDAHMCQLPTGGLEMSPCQVQCKPSPRRARWRRPCITPAVPRTVRPFMWPGRMKSAAASTRSSARQAPPANAPARRGNRNALRKGKGRKEDFLKKVLPCPLQTSPPPLPKTL